MARTTKKYGGVNYIADDDFDYTTAIGEAASHGDYDYAASLERSRNAKIDGEGLSYAKTYKYQNGTSPVYESKYGGKIDKTLSQIMNRKPFEYDYTKDDSYKALQKVYIQNGKLAMQDTLGDAAALTGGRASSAAVSASQQAYNRYMAELSANIPALEQAAYGRYKDEEASLYNELGVLQGMENAEYGRWSDSWDRDHMLGREAIEDARYNEDIKYRDERDAIEDARYDDQVNYGKDMDAINRLMQIAGTTGDYSVLRQYPELAEKYGFSEEVVAALNKAHADGVSEKKVAEAFARAQYMAQYGNFSYFKEAGFTDEQIAAMEEYWKKGELREDALFAAEFGDYSKLSELGITPNIQSNVTYNGAVKTVTTPETSAEIVLKKSDSSGDSNGNDKVTGDSNGNEKNPDNSDSDNGASDDSDDDSNRVKDISGLFDKKPGEDDFTEDDGLDEEIPDGPEDNNENVVSEDYSNEDVIKLPDILGGYTVAVDTDGADQIWYGDDINDTFDFDSYNNPGDSDKIPVNNNNNYKTKGDGTENYSVRNRNGKSWVYVSGYGRLGWNELGYYVDEGRIKEVIDKKSKTIYYVAK